MYIYKSCKRRVRRQQVFTIDQAPVLMLLAHLFCIYNPGRAAFHPTRKTTSFLQGVVSLFIFTLCWTRVLPNLKVIRRKYKSSRGVFGKGEIWESKQEVPFDLRVLLPNEQRFLPTELRLATGRKAPISTQFTISIEIELTASLHAKWFLYNLIERVYK